MKCLECRFYLPTGEENLRHECSGGECHRFPAYPFLSKGDATDWPITIQWPPVFDFDFCGEFQPKEAK